jgi:hypothetical protein
MKRNEGELSMNMIIRQKGGRRFGLHVEFPLEDRQGVSVIQDRRRLPDRRKEKYGLDDLKVILTKMADSNLY